MHPEYFLGAPQMILFQCKVFVGLITLQELNSLANGFPQTTSYILFSGYLGGLMKGGGEGGGAGKLICIHLTPVLFFIQLLQLFLYLAQLPGKEGAACTFRVYC